VTLTPSLLIIALQIAASLPQQDAAVRHPVLAWRLQSGGPVRSSPVIADGVVYIGTTDGRVCAIDLASGDARLDNADWKCRRIGTGALDGSCVREHAPQRRRRARPTLRQGSLADKHRIGSRHASRRRALGLLFVVAHPRRLGNHRRER
jgi:hypothetical protein